jgi:uncharacterized coiled-coil DUF342 family protein
MERNITHNRFVCAAYEKDMMELRDKAAASEIQARQFSAEVADLRIETKERWAALDTLREKHRELAALQATMQDINNGLRADLSQAHNACLEYRTHNTQLRKELDEANYKYEQLDFSVNESVKKSSAYKEVAAHVSELQQILHRLGVSYTLT